MDSVDAFQGREKPYIILSLVRSSDNRSVRFLERCERINVAVTRAQCGLVCVGDPLLGRVVPLIKGLVGSFVAGTSVVRKEGHFVPYEPLPAYLASSALDASA